MVSDKLYQRKEPLISSVHTKVKGVAEVREEVPENGRKKVVSRVFDTADYTFPVQVSTAPSSRDGTQPCSPGPAPSPGARSLTPEKTLARFKKLCENPN